MFSFNVGGGLLAVNYFRKKSRGGGGGVGGLLAVNYFRKKFHHRYFIWY